AGLAEGDSHVFTLDHVQFQPSSPIVAMSVKIKNFYKKLLK
ncbi:10705_t:CDS:1, partial [Gigaspora rosea]